MNRQLILLLGLGLVECIPIWASTVPIGDLSFDLFTPPANGSPGVDAFSISNFTGAFDLQPDFPASTGLTLMNATLTVDPSGGSPEVIALDDIGPGLLLDPDGNPPLVLQFPDTIDFTSASFTATLSPTTLVLSDGSVFVAGPAISATLSPSSGSLLAPGDSALITAQSPAAVPEPETWMFFGTAVLLRTLWRAPRNNQKLPPFLRGLR